MNQPFAASDFQLPIIDAHHHFFLFGPAAHYPWLQDEYDENFFLGEYKSMCKPYLYEDYRVDVDGFNVIGDVHVEAERSRRQQIEETVDLTKLHEETSLPSAIIGHVYFTQPDRDEILKKQAGFPLVRGIRSKPVTAPNSAASVWGEPGSLQDPKWQEGLAELEKYDFSWDLRVPYWHLSEAAEVLADFPNLPVAINHAGLPLDRTSQGFSGWRKGMEALAQYANVTVKVSELGLENGLWDVDSNQRVVSETIEIFGYDRSMFASNLPVCNLSTSFGEIVRLILAAVPKASEAQLRELFAGTAARHYGLEALLQGH